MDYQGGQYGVAILSRFPIGATDHRKYENRREAERRGVIRLEVNVGGKTINFVTTHLITCTMTAGCLKQNRC